MIFPKKPIVITGPSGAGKSELIKYVMSKDGDFVESKGCTTRQPRDMDDFMSMYFLTREEFEKKIANNEFLEHTIYNGEYYGTQISEMSKLYKHNLLFSVAYSAGKVIKEMDPEAVMIYILPPNAQELRKRLGDRYTPERFTKGITETMDNSQHYDYLLISETGNMEAVYQNFMKIVNREGNYQDFRIDNPEVKKFLERYYDDFLPGING